MPGKHRVPLRLLGFKLLPLVVEAQETLRRRRMDRALRHADRARQSLLHQLLPGHELRVAAQQNIRTATGHVRGNRHHAQPPGLRYNLRLALVELGIQHHVPHTLALQRLREQFALLNRRGAHQNRLPALVNLGNVVGHGLVLLFCHPEDHIRVVGPQHGLVRRNDGNLQLVDVVELGGFGFGRARHAGELAVEPEVVLEGDRRQRLIFLADGHAFLGLHRLVQPIGPPPTRHQSSGEGVHDDHFAVLDHVVHVTLVERMRLDRRLHVVLQIPVLRVGNVADAQQLLDLQPAVIGHADRAHLLIDHIVAGENLDHLLFFNLLALLQMRNDPLHAVIFVRRLVRRAGDDQRRPRLVDQDRVHLVDNRVVVPALHAVLDVELHVVAQIIKAELIVRAIGDVGGIGGAALVVVQIMHNHADGQPQELVDLAHPLGIALGQIVVDRDHMHAMAGQCIQIAGQRGHQRLAFAGPHFGNLALMQHHAANQLHVKVAHAQHSPAGLAHHGKGLRQQRIQRRLLGYLARLGLGHAGQLRGNPLAKLRRLGPQLLIRQGLHLGLKSAYARHHRHHALDGAIIAGTKYLR